jgi:hypothetical protein
MNSYNDEKIGQLEDRVLWLKEEREEQMRLNHTIRDTLLRFEALLKKIVGVTR